MAWEGILRALWIFLPAYVANMAPVFVAKLIPGWNSPIDGGRIGKDGHRILGDGKTWRGFAGGALMAGAMALFLAVLAPGPSAIPSPSPFDGWGFAMHGYEAGSHIGTSTFCETPGCRTLVESSPLQVFLFGAIVGFMALVGDAVKSYFKRRRGKEGGAPWFPFDQLDFVVFGLLGFMIASPLLPAGWVWHALTDDWVILATLFILTPALHLLVNRIGYWLGLKKVPW